MTSGALSDDWSPPQENGYIKTNESMLSMRESSRTTTSALQADWTFTNGNDASINNGSMQSMRESCSMTPLDDTVSKDGYAGKEGMESKLENMVLSLYLGGMQMLWKEMQYDKPSFLHGKNWQKYMIKTAVELDFVMQIYIKELVMNMSQVETKHMASHAFQLVIGLISEGAQIKYFLDAYGLWHDTTKENKTEVEDDCSIGGAQGSAEDAPLDDTIVAGTSDKKKVKKNKRKKKQWMLDNTGELHHQCRGGMNRYSCLAPDSEEEDTQTAELHASMLGYKCLTMEEEIAMQEKYEKGSDCCSNIDAEDKTESESQDSEHSDQLLETSICSSASGSGRSFYKEFFEKKQQIRGGALGSSTTKNKQLTDALKNLTKMVSEMDPTQHDEEQEDQELKELMRELAKAARRWENNIPSRKELQEQLKKFLFMVENCGKSTSSSSRPASGNHHTSQSFYGQFQSKLKTDGNHFMESLLQGKEKNKGKGKGKGKSKVGSKSDDLPKFDLKRSFPSKEIVPWQLVAKQLEQGDPPQGEITIVDSPQRMLEFIALTEAHGIDKEITMICKHNPECTNTVTGSKVIFLPYYGNIALVQALAATTKAANPSIEGLQPKKIQEPESKAAEDITLRITIDMQFIVDPRLIEMMEEQPHVALHKVLKEIDCVEMKTRGWVLNGSIWTGYAIMDENKAKKLLARSGYCAVFWTRLRKDIAQYPDATWYPMESKEEVTDYFKRITIIANEAKVPLVHRSGGGAALGIQKADQSDKNHSWEVSGVPASWGPATVKKWAEERGWVVIGKPLSPKGRFKCWGLQGHIPGQPSLQEQAYEISMNGEVHFLTFKRWFRPRKVDVNHDKKLTGNQWWTHDASDPIEDCPPTLIDHTQMEVETQDEALLKEATAKSPPKKKLKAEARKLCGGQPGPSGTTLVEVQGEGECGWRAAALGISLINNKGSTIEQIVDKLEIIATSLRVRTVSFLKSNVSKWSPQWKPDEKATYQTENGKPATNLQEFLASLDRPKRWICGLTLAACAMQQKCCFVIWTIDEESPNQIAVGWKRIAIIKGGHGTLPVVPLVLHEKHFYGLRLPIGKKNWPREWLQPMDEQIPTTQSVEDTQQCQTVLRGGCNDESDFQTPKKQIDDIEGFLKPFSSTKRMVEDCIRTCSSMTSSAKRKDRHDGACSSRKTINSLPSWSCPVCNLCITLEDRKKGARKVTKHLSEKHHVIWRESMESNGKWRRNTSNLGLRSMHDPVDFIEWNGSKNNVYFPCAYCNKVLPKFFDGQPTKTQKYIIRRSKMFHLRTKCVGKKAKKATLYQYWLDSVRKHRSFFVERPDAPTSSFWNRKILRSRMDINLFGSMSSIASLTACMCALVAGDHWPLLDLERRWNAMLDALKRAPQRLSGRYLLDLLSGN